MPAAEVQGVANQYGVNKTPLLVEADQLHRLPADEHVARLFKGNTNAPQGDQLRDQPQAAYVAQAGPYAGDPWTHIFNPGVPGWRNVSIYKQNLTKAKKLAKGHFKTRQDHRWLPLVRHDQPGSRPRSSGMTSARSASAEQHHHEAVLGRRSLRRHGQEGHRPRHGRLHGLVLGLPGPVRLDQHPAVRRVHPGARTTSTTPTSTTRSGTRRWTRRPGSSGRSGSRSTGSWTWTS